MDYKTIEQRILESAEQLFYQFGYTKTTTEDIARESSVSKRTLYKYFNSKSHILEELISTKTGALTTELTGIINSNDIFPTKLHRALTTTSQALSKISKQFLEDVQRNVPGIWQIISNYRKEMINIVFLNLLDEGIKTGYIKKSINRGVAVLVMISVMDNIIDASVEKTLPHDLSSNLPRGFNNMFDEIISIIYNGILNDTNVLDKS